MGKLLFGKPVADKITEDIKFEVLELKENNINPKLEIIRVGNYGDDISYQKSAIRRMKKCGIETEIVELDENSSESKILDVIEKANNDDSIHGILMFNSFPECVNEEKIKSSIDARKDVDSFNPENLAKLLTSDEMGFAPCTAQASMEILDYYKIPIEGKRAVVLGRSLVVGKPVALLLLAGNATVNICHSKTMDIEKVCREGDILVSAMGRPHFVNENFVKDGATIIDVGINVSSEGKISGDVDIDRVIDKVSGVTPVPKGVGAVTTAVLAKHVLKACKIQNGEF